MAHSEYSWEVHGNHEDGISLKSLVSRFISQHMTRFESKMACLPQELLFGIFDNLSSDELLRMQYEAIALTRSIRNAHSLFRFTDPYLRNRFDFYRDNFHYTLYYELFARKACYMISDIEAFSSRFPEFSFEMVVIDESGGCCTDHMMFPRDLRFI